MHMRLFLAMTIIRIFVTGKHTGRLTLAVCFSRNYDLSIYLPMKEQRLLPFQWSLHSKQHRLLAWLHPEINVSLQ